MMEPVRAEMVAPGPGGTSVGGEAVAGVAITEDVIQSGEIVILDPPSARRVDPPPRAAHRFLAIVALALVSEMWLTLQPGRIVSVSGALIASVLAVYAVDMGAHALRSDRPARHGDPGRLGIHTGGSSPRRSSPPSTASHSNIRCASRSSGSGTLVFIPDHGERIGWEMLGRAEDVYAIARETVERYGRSRPDE